MGGYAKYGMVDAELDASLEKVEALGGKVVAPNRDTGGSRMAVIADPAGAVLALYEPGPDSST